jgi:hypothetical protein
MESSSALPTGAANRRIGLSLLSLPEFSGLSGLT